LIVVVDSGIWISAIEFGGTPSAALELVLQTDDLAICPEIEQEVLRILSQKFGRDPAAIVSRLTPFWENAIRVRVTGEIKGISRDPNDDPILECAVKADAQILISGDKDLLSLNSYLGVRILSARQYLQEHQHGRL
jgi:putative PIN family toxin of toxin-antitoxin system